MIQLYYAPRTRAVRVRWLLEELGLEHELIRVAFTAPTDTFQQETPSGKVPVLRDGDVEVCESGAIVEYLLERYDPDGRFAPQVGSPLRGRYLQWIHYAEGTAYPPLATIIWHTLYRPDAERLADVIENARTRAWTAFDFLEQGLGDQPYLLGETLSGADVMTGFTLAVARALGVLGERHPGLVAYMDRLEARPAFQRAAGD